MNQRLERWRARRAEHLAALPWLVTDAAGPRTVRYVGDELLAVDEHYDDARSAVSAQGKSAADLVEDEPLPGVRRIRARGLDPLRAARRVRERAGDVQVGPNHVLLGTPHWQGGPFGRPVVSAAATLAAPGPQAPVRVAVMDTGVWSDSPLPVSRYTVGASDYETNTDADGDSVIDSDVGHANFIAGVVLQGTSQARVRIVKVLDSFGVGTELDLAQKVATLDDTDILNLSLGGYTADDQPPVLLRWALNRFLLGQDRLVVAAAGNDGQAGPPFWPAAFAGAGVAWKDQVIAVAAHDGTAVCQWSNTGSWVSVAAPGADVVSTYINHPEFTTGWAAWSGTSFATPHVVAAIAEAAHTGGVVAAAKQVLSGTAVSFAGYPAIS